MQIFMISMVYPAELPRRRVKAAYMASAPRLSRRLAPDEQDGRMQDDRPSGVVAWPLCVLRDTRPGPRPAGFLRMRYAFDGITKSPHAEEPPPAASPSTHRSGPSPSPHF